MLQLVTSAPQRRNRRTIIAMTDDQSPPNPESFAKEEIPTVPGHSRPDEYDTSFLRDDSTFSQAVRIVAKAARAIEQEREERRLREFEEHQARQSLREQQEEILRAIEKADRNSTTNYQMVREELRLLKQSDVAQDGKIAQLEKLPSTFEERLVELRTEILAKLPESIQAAMRPFVDRLEKLEREDAQRRAPGLSEG